MLNPEEADLARSQRVKLDEPPTEPYPFIHPIMCNHCELRFQGSFSFTQHCKQVLVSLLHIVAAYLTTNA